MSAQEMYDKAEQFGPWINRVLLGIVAYFLIQTNSKFNEVIIKIDTALITQAAQEERLNTLEQKQEMIRSDIKELEKEDRRFNQNISRFYQEYGYLFTDKAKRRLE